MNIPQVVTFHYDLRDEAGQLIESSKGKNPMTFMEGTSLIITGLEDALRPLEPGTVKEIFIPYQEAYGPYDQSLVAQVPRSQFPPDEVKVGDIYRIEKEGAIRLISVVEVTADQVTIDANHPMAGKNLSFLVEIVSRRNATAEEIEHGHVHGEGGHHHHH